MTYHRSYINNIFIYIIPSYYIIYLRIQIFFTIKFYSWQYCRFERRENFILNQ